MKLNSPKITVAIPVYNGADYLKIAIESALAQTYKNTEIIVLDDGSNDGGLTSDIAKSFGEKVRYIYQKNQGVAGAMNHVLKVMSGEFFTWLSHDDIHRCEKIALQFEYFKLLDRENAIIYSDVLYIDGHGEKIGESCLDFLKYSSSPKRALLESAINGCTLFIPIKVMREVGPFDENLKYVQDYALWSKILRKYDFFLLPSPLISYRIHADQGTRHPEAVVEGDSLWIDIASQRTAVERVQISGSSRQYFNDLAKFLASTPYKHAATQLKSLASEAAHNTLVTIILVASENIQDCLMTAANILMQSHKKIELLIASSETSNHKLTLHHWAQFDDRVKVVVFKDEEKISILRRCLFYVSGEYIAFADEKSLYLDHKIEKQMNFMQQAGVAMTTTRMARVSRRYPAPDKNDATSAAMEAPDVGYLSALMIHRSVVCSAEMGSILKLIRFDGGCFLIPPNVDLPLFDDCLLALLD